jgi:hypothetical protein
LFFADREGVHDSEILPLVSRTLDPVNPREWYWALMDYGAYLGKNIPNPNKRKQPLQETGRFRGFGPPGTGRDHQDPHKRGQNGKN